MANQIEGKGGSIGKTIIWWAISSSSCSFYYFSSSLLHQLVHASTRGSIFERFLAFTFYPKKSFASSTFYNLDSNLVRIVSSLSFLVCFFLSSSRYPFVHSISSSPRLASTNFYKVLHYFSFFLSFFLSFSLSLSLSLIFPRI